MHHNSLERRWGDAGFGDHPLKHRASIICGRRTRFNIFSAHTVARCLTPGPHLTELVWNGEIFFCLFTRRDPRI